MVSYDPVEVESVLDPSDVADCIAHLGDRSLRSTDEVVAAVQESENPLNEPIGLGFSSGSVGSCIRHGIFRAIQERDDIHNAGRPKVGGVDEMVSLTTHPALLDGQSRFLAPGPVAKFYEYGYSPLSLNVLQGGNPGRHADFDAEGSWEFRTLELYREDEWVVADAKDAERWFADEEAVSEFATRVTANDVAWEQYIPWYRTQHIPTYLLDTVARNTDWTQYPDFPEIRPQLNSEFESPEQPRVGDFIRTAVIQQLQEELPSIKNISTGPDPWTTDRVSMLVKPSPYNEPGVGTEVLCPRIVLVKLNQYGYRLIDAWYDTPAVSQERENMLPRRVEFARGNALREWCQTVSASNGLSVSEDIETARKYVGGDLNLEELVPCLRTQIVTNHQLHQHAERVTNR